MRKIMWVVVIAAVFAGFSVAAGAGDKKDEVASGAGVKIGYVDLNRVLNETNEGKAAKAKLEADGKAKKQKLEILQNDLKKMKEDLDKQKLILSAEALKEKEGKFQDKYMELQQMGMNFEQQFAQAETQAIKPISDKIQRTIQEIGAAEGYTIIVPREMALYTPAGTDLTDRVIATYNKGK